MNDAESQMTAEEAAACEAAYEAWIAKARETGEGRVPDAFTAGWLAGLAMVTTHSSYDA